MMACAREEIIVSETSVQDTPIGMQAQKGRLRLKFKSRFAGKAEQAVYTRAGTGDIRIVSMKRLFPFAGKFEERTRKAGLHLWYEVEFDEQTPVTRALALLGDTTEIEIAEPVYIIRIPEERERFLQTVALFQYRRVTEFCGRGGYQFICGLAKKSRVEGSYCGGHRRRY